MFPREQVSDASPDEPDFESSELGWELDNYGYADDADAVPASVRLRDERDWAAAAFSELEAQVQVVDIDIKLSLVLSYLRLIRSAQENEDTGREQKKISQLMRASGLTRDDVMDLLTALHDYGEERVEDVLRGDGIMTAEREKVRERLRRLFDKSAD